ncbi:MAG: cation diffusion facilitator family transporter [Lutisporaceae bacterium]
MQRELYRGQEARKITLIGFWVNAVLAVFKVLAGIIGNSGAMIADSVHSLSDFLTDIVVLIGFKLTEKPEDDCHNYGHEKYETLVTVIISIFLGIVGFEILKSGIVNIITVIKGSTLTKPGVIALIAAVVSIVVKELLYRYTIVVGNKINSSAVKANAWHHRSDAFSSIGTLIGIGGAIVLGEKWTILDPIASVIVSIFIFKVAVDIFIPAVNELMESSLSKDEIEHIRNIIICNNKVLNFHNLRTRRIGTKAAIEFHILLDSSADLRSAHDVATEIEQELKTSFNEESIITIHVEPL